MTENSSDVSDISCKCAASQDIDVEQTDNVFETPNIGDDLARKNEQPSTCPSRSSSECDSENEQTAGSSEPWRKNYPGPDGCHETPSVSQHATTNGQSPSSQEVEREKTDQKQSHQASNVLSIKPVEISESQTQLSLEGENPESSKEPLVMRITPRPEKEIVPRLSESGGLEASSEISPAPDVSQQESEIHCVRSSKETIDPQTIQNPGISHHSQEVKSSQVVLKTDNFQHSQENDTTGQLENGDDSQSLQNPGES